MLPALPPFYYWLIMPCSALCLCGGGQLGRKAGLCYLISERPLIPPMTGDLITDDQEAAGEMEEYSSITWLKQRDACSGDHQVQLSLQQRIMTSQNLTPNLVRQAVTGSASHTANIQL